MRKYTQKSYETGGIRVGSNSHYTDIGTDGALTDVGTQTHNLNAVTIATLTATNVATTTRYLDLPVARWDTNSGASCSIDTVALLSSASTVIMRFSTAASVPGAADLSAALFFRAPTDMLAANAASIALLTSHTTTGGSNAVWKVSASAYGDLEATAGTTCTASVIDTLSGSVANSPHLVNLGAFSASGIAADDLVLLKLDFLATSASHFRLESDVFNVRFAYKANTLA
jgi:hypothetical protein